MRAAILPILFSTLCCALPTVEIKLLTEKTPSGNAVSCFSALRIGVNYKSQPKQDEGSLYFKITDLVSAKRIQFKSHLEQQMVQNAEFNQVFSVSIRPPKDELIAAEKEIRIKVANSYPNPAEKNGLLSLPSTGTLLDNIGITYNTPGKFRVDIFQEGASDDPIKQFEVIIIKEGKISDLIQIGPNGGVVGINAK